jgi:hypothetical protein
MATALQAGMKQSIFSLAVVSSLFMAACGDDVVVKSPDDERHEERAEDAADRAEDKADRAEDKADEAADEAEKAKDRAD